MTVAMQLILPTKVAYSRALSSVVVGLLSAGDREWALGSGKIVVFVDIPK